MPRRLLAGLAAACAAFAMLASACVAEPLFPLGSRVGLEPPGALKPSSRFAGFEDADRRVAITVLDLPGADYAELERAASTKLQAGFGEIKREEFTFHSGKGLLITGRVKAAGATLRKWVLLATAADQDLTALVAVEVPEAAFNVYPEPSVRKALASVTFRPPPIQEQLGLLPFKLGELAGFRVMKVFPGGAMLIDGPGEDLSKQSYVIVSIGRGAPDQAADRARFARDLLSSAPLQDLHLQSADEMRINGAPGFEIRAQAQGPQGEPVMVAQWLRFAGDGFVRVVGIGRQQDWNALFMRLRAVRDGVELR